MCVLKKKQQKGAPPSGHQAVNHFTGAERAEKQNFDTHITHITCLHLLRNTIAERMMRWKNGKRAAERALVTSNGREWSISRNITMSTTLI